MGLESSLWRDLHTGSDVWWDILLNYTQPTATTELLWVDSVVNVREAEETDDPGIEEDDGE